MKPPIIFTGNTGAVARPILFTDHATALGGAQHSLLLLFDLLDRTRFTPHLATQPGALAEAARAHDAQVHEVVLKRLRGTPMVGWHLARGTSALMRIIRRERIALVLPNTMRSSFYASLAARLVRRPLVWHVHDIFQTGVYRRVMCALADAVIAVSAAVAAPLPCPQKVRLVPNAVRADDFRTDREAGARLRTHWGVPPTASLVGQVARLQPWKGQREVIAVAETLLRHLPDVFFVIVGGDIFADAPAYEAELKALVRARGLAQRVIFTGHQYDVAAVLSALDALVHASDNEPFGRILIEAAAAAVPVAAYASGAVGEIVRHEVTGLLVPPGDRAALAAALRRLLTDPSLARRLGDNARADVRTRFDAQRFAREMEAVFQEVLEKRGRGSCPAG